MTPPHPPTTVLGLVELESGHYFRQPMDHHGSEDEVDYFADGDVESTEIAPVALASE